MSIKIAGCLVSGSYSYHLNLSEFALRNLHVSTRTR